jgi:hypothetical protein
MRSDIASPGAGSTDFERMAHYREQTAQFRQWAEEETVPERYGLLDMARQYEQLASVIEAKSRRPMTMTSKPKTEPACVLEDRQSPDDGGHEEIRFDQ